MWFARAHFGRIDLCRARCSFAGGKHGLRSYEQLKGKTMYRVTIPLMVLALVSPSGCAVDSEDEADVIAVANVNPDLPWRSTYIVANTAVGWRAPEISGGSVRAPENSRVSIFRGGTRRLGAGKGERLGLRFKVRRIPLAGAGAFINCTLSNRTVIIRPEGNRVKFGGDDSIAFSEPVLAGDTFFIQRRRAGKVGKWIISHTRPGVFTRRKRVGPYDDYGQTFGRVPTCVLVNAAIKNVTVQADNFVPNQP